MLIDKSGSPFNAGDVAEVFLQGMFIGQVIEVKDSILSIAGAGSVRNERPRVIVQLALELPADKTGLVAGAYVIGRAKKPDSEATKQ